MIFKISSLKTIIWFCSLGLLDDKLSCQKILFDIMDFFLITPALIQQIQIGLPNDLPFLLLFTFSCDVKTRNIQVYSFRNSSIPKITRELIYPLPITTLRICVLSACSLTIMRHNIFQLAPQIMPGRADHSLRGSFISSALGINLHAALRFP